MAHTQKTPPRTAREHDQGWTLTSSDSVPLTWLIKPTMYLEASHPKKTQLKANKAAVVIAKKLPALSQGGFLTCVTQLL